MRPMSMREIDALCYERGVEFDPETVRVEELAEMARVIVARPVWEGRSAAQELDDRRAAERREPRRIPEWFSPQDLLREPWEREAAHTVS
jgi:hypothetical protein